MRLTTLSLSAALFASLGSAQLGIKLANGGLTPTTQQYLEGKYDKSLIPVTGITIEAWITYDDGNLPTGWRYPTICRMNPNASKEAYWLRVDAHNRSNRSLAWGVQTSTGLQRIGYTFTAGEFKTWTHVAATYDGSKLTMYINGVQKAQSTISVGPRMVNNGGVFRIGTGEVTGANEMWNGELDEIRMWPYARTAAEIKSTMNFSLANVPGMVSTWNLDFTGNDSSGGNNLTVMNKVSFGTNTLKLTGAKLGGAGFGASTAGCSSTPSAGVSAHAVDGNQDFAITCVGAPEQGKGTGFIWAGTGRLQTAFSLGPMALWVDPGKPGLLLPVVADSNGLIRLPLKLPTGSKGSTLHCQFAFAANGCAISPFSSQGLTISVQ